MSHHIEPFFFSEAVKQFWKKRIDSGEEIAIRGGKQLDGFSEKIRLFLIQGGISPNDIFIHKKKEIPGFYRPTKAWDFLVVSKDELKAVIELKSMVGSFGSNCNNRIEEAVGNAADIWVAYREGAFQLSPRPWLGFFFLLEDCEESTTPVRVTEPHFRVFPEFKCASYAQRIELGCRKLVRERQYDSTCLILSKKENDNQLDNYSEPATDLNVNQFLTQLFHHLGCK